MFVAENLKILVNKNTLINLPLGNNQYSYFRVYSFPVNQFSKNKDGIVQYRLFCKLFSLYT